MIGPFMYRWLRGSRGVVGSGAAFAPGARRHLSLAVAAVFLLMQGLLVTIVPASADTTSASTWGPQFPPSCPTGTYTVPTGTRYVEVIAVGGAGRGGWTFNDTNTGGPGGSGARVRAILPVTAGQVFKVVVAHNGDAADPSVGYPNGGPTAFDSGKGGGSSVVTTGAGDPCLGASAPRGAVMVLAGGGGGGGGATVLGSGGAGGNAGATIDFSGQPGTRAYFNDSAHYDGGSGGGGGTVAAAGSGGGGGCAIYCARDGLAGTGFTGGAGRPSFQDNGHPDSAGGAGGGGYYGGGGGGGGNTFGGGGGGAGASYITPTNYPISISQDTSGQPSVTITPLANPTTTATLSGTTSGNNWYTSALTVTLTARAGTFGLGKTYFALDDPGCSAANIHALDRCTEYKGPFTILGGLHTLTYFSVDAQGLDEAVQTRSFAVTRTSAGVTAASIGSGTNPTATAGGPAGTAGTISVSATGSGVVGAAVYTANPAGAPVFKSSGAYVDVTVAGSGLSSVTIKDCHLNGGTNVYWNTGTGWALVSNQTYDPVAHCVTVTVNGTTVPTLSQLAGTPFAAGSPPSTTAVATTADGKPYTAGTWTNQSVTVAFTCSANATPTASVTRTGDGQNQSAVGTCTDGLKQATTATFTGINVDKTAPTITAVGTPTSIWPPNHKLIDVTVAVALADTLSGPDGFVLLSATASGDPTDIQGFVVGAASTSGQLRANKDEVYTLTYRGKDKAGNTATAVVTIAVPHNK
jgi:hypothetical protein